MVDLLALKAELTTDPETLGYTGDDVNDAEILNTVRVGNNGVTRTLIPTREIVEAIDYAADWAGLSAALRDALLLVTSALEIDASNPRIRAVFTTAFGPATATRANLVALQTRDGTRAEELFGPDVFVTTSDVADARRA